MRVAELDAEHERCAAALRLLAERRDAVSLRRVVEEYAAHFAHEEGLLDEHLYDNNNNNNNGESDNGGGDGATEASSSLPSSSSSSSSSGVGGGGGGGGGFSIAGSMRRSHWADHKLMLDELAALQSALLLRGGDGSGGDGGGSGGGDGGGDGASAVLSLLEVDFVLRRFKKHADLYDSSYAVPLSQKMAMAVGGAASR